MAEKLTEYRKKRDFNKTAEPSGEESKRGKSAETAKARKKGANKRLRFAVQYHIARRVHYDFRLEWKGVLLSWAVPKGPSYNPADKRLAVMVEDHPLDYAGFEGTIPKGQYGGGTVMLWDEGEWEPQEDFAAGLEKGSLKIVLYGSRLKGRWALVRLKSKEGETADNWLLLKEKDSFAQTEAGIDGFATSIKTGRTTDEIAAQEDKTAKSNPIDNAEVQLAKLVDEVPEGDEWLYEVKYDGYRIVSYTERGGTRLVTRNGHDYTDKFKPVADALTKWAAGRALVADGEMIVTDKAGKPDFQALQSYVKEPNDKPLAYVMFDLLALDGEDLRDLPLIERKNRLAGLLSKAPACLSFSRHVVGQGRRMFEAAAELGLEGIVGKRTDSAYRGDRSGDWIKLKCYRRQEFVIGGYTRSSKKTDGVSALLLGVYEGETLTYAGRAGTGIGAQTTRELQEAFAGLETDKSPFVSPPKARSGEEIFWLNPALLAEVQFAEWTAENQLRQASFKGLRSDKAPKEVIREQTGGDDPKPEAAKPPAARASKLAKKGGVTVDGVEISSPEKVIFERPTVKKIDVIRYYEAVAKRMLPYAAGRILSVVRCHKGAAGACFFKKHPTTKSEGVTVIPVRNSDGKSSDYFYIDSLVGLISEAQLGTLEFHIWGSRADDIEKPDMMVFDLDPDEGMDIAQVRRGVKDLKSVLASLSLKSFLKTSGGKGYHVVVPFQPVTGWDAFHDFARGVAELMESKWPNLYTSNIRKNRRKGKIFIDWVRNGRGATSVAPYSLRARPGARVSMPISWSELDTVAPDGIDLFEALARLKKPDPWKDFYKTEQTLKI